MKKPAAKRKGPSIAAAAVLVVVGAYLGLCAWVGNAGVMPNVTVAGLDVSGKGMLEIQPVVAQAMEEHGGNARVTLVYDNWSGSITGDQLEIFGENSALSAWEVGRGSFLTRGAQYIRHLMGGSTEVELDLSLQGIEQPALEQLLDQAEQSIGSDVNQSGYEIVGDQLVMTKGKSGLAIEREQIKEQVFQAFEKEALPGAFQGAATEVTVEIAPTETPSQEPDFDAIHSELCIQPKNAEVDPETYEVIAHINGIEFETAALKAAYDQAAEGETFSIPVTVISPEETAESLQAKLFRDLLGEGTSAVGGSANRKFNVKLSAEACNNVILMPGEEFSYNNTTGSRSEDKGYLPAPVYSGGQSVDETGGGICQTSSTIYYAVLHTTLEVVERSAHMYATGYVPDGMDATVYFGALDFRFKNNTNYPIKIVTESYDKNSKRYLTVKIYGTNEDGRYAKPERVQFDWEEPTTTYVADETIPQGTTKEDEKQNPYTGRKAQTYRYVYEKDGTLVEKQDMGVSKYKMRTRTVYYNPLDGDPATWIDGVPPQPVVEQPQPVQPTIPEPPAVTEQPEENPVESEETTSQEDVGGAIFPGGPIIG